MESLTVYDINDSSPITTLSDYIGKKVIIATTERERVYIGVLESAAFENTSVGDHREATLTVYFRGRNTPVHFVYNVDAVEDSLIVHVLPA